MAREEGQTQDSREREVESRLEVSREVCSRCPGCREGEQREPRPGASRVFFRGWHCLCNFTFMSGRA